ncbi:hypothetical protein J2X71_001558 [Rhizobium sp. 1399]|nr:hypothetical protein [Rhizobium sp. 1399]
MRSGFTTQSLTSSLVAERAGLTCKALLARFEEFL